MILSQVCQRSLAACDATATVESDQCQLRQKLCYTNQLLYVVMFTLFVCVLLYVVSLHYDAANARHTHCDRCPPQRHRSTDTDYDRTGYFFFG